ncbi:E3 ubiquitin/ISG15 ligase TRIM25-like [Rhinatrema bivittatum]|uniref:E3 ubiquitin/ISG15 ligase TRIM25-like n=1 Tax=Rhinatrema bivittatum TaxID=194408 RepID=UPI001128F75B|nr:E3 ubiquitin/ISG15 ligase TRIM25-like [Rhinatrema bivittatum]XP_029433128.1 E3 ubiquitin/ISG15 ligase TRIM25-like [Rhinatrema bivittatum]XP_029433129.1 E3 ubiquitin/ISG15 ligase TRIM25-like [Rhinatrema bivittatum]
MAAAALEEELSCSICLSVYQDPVLLTCGHNFCLNCIEKVWDSQKAKNFTCPECRMKFSKRPRLRKNRKLCNIVTRYLSTWAKKEEAAVFCSYCLDMPMPAIKTCVQCETSFCENHLQKHNKAVEHDMTEPTTCLEGRKCSTHWELLKYYCMVDDCCICVSCCVAGKHKNHPANLLPDAQDKKKASLQHTLRELNFQTEKHEKTLAEVQKDRDTVNERITDITANVKGLFMDIKMQLGLTEKQILEKIEVETNYVLGILTEEAKVLEAKKATVAEKLRKVKDLCAVTDPLVFLKRWERSAVKDYSEVEDDHSSWGNDTAEEDYEEDYDDDDEYQEEYEVKAYDEDTLDEELIETIIETELNELVYMLPTLRERRGI